MNAPALIMCTGKNGTSITVDTMEYKGDIRVTFFRRLEGKNSTQRIDIPLTLLVEAVARLKNLNEIAEVREIAEDAEKDKISGEYGRKLGKNR